MTDEILDTLKEEAAKLGSDFLRDGIDLVKKQLHGEASEQQMRDWLRAAQGRGST